MGRQAGSKYALLGMLTEGTLSGYDIRQRIELGTSNFWTESYGQIYPQLKRLSEARLVEKVSTEQKDGRPERHLYAITEAGRQELRRWLARAVEQKPIRSELLLKLYFASEAEPAVLLAHISQHQAWHRDKLAHFQTLEDMVHGLKVSDAKKTGWLLTLSYGRHASEAASRWCEEAREVLEKSQMRPAKTKAQRV